MPKYTLRQNGRQMVNINLTIAVDKEEVEALAGAAKISEAAALKMIREEYLSEAKNAVHYHTFARYKDSGEIVYVHIDDVGQADKYAYESL